MKRALALLTAAAALGAAAPAQAGTVKAQPRSCTPKRTHVVERRGGVIISMREAWYACATRYGHSYNLFAPIYREQLAPSDGGCELGTNVNRIRVHGHHLRYRLACSFGEGVDGDSTVRIKCRLDLRTGRIHYRRLDRG